MSQGTLVAGRYRLDVEVGHGGMGRVWKAWDVRLDREVAVKTVDLSAAADPSTAPRFQREIVATAKLNHPGVVTVFDGGVDGNTAYLVMEFLRGRTLDQLIRQEGPLQPARGVQVVQQVVTGLAAAHAAGLVHRDIKPANVMITDSAVKLLDFGIAQLAQEAGAGLTATATTIGTAAYMSPEQAAGQRVGAPTDLYAIGCLITFIFTGRAPFQGENAIAIASQQLHATPPRLDATRPDLPPALTDLVGRLLAKDPAARPDAAETLAALRAIQAEPAGTATLPLASVLPVPAPTRVLPVSSGPAPAVASGPPPGHGWIAGSLVTVIAALALGGLAFSLTSQGMAPSGQGPTAGASKKPTAPATSKKPTTPAKPSPAASSSAQPSPLAGALAAVRAALNSIPADDAASRRIKAQLLRSWDNTADRIKAGVNPKKQLANFRKMVDAAEKDGVVGPLQASAIRAALGLVGALI